MFCGLSIQSKLCSFGKTDWLPSCMPGQSIVLIFWVAIVVPFRIGFDITPTNDSWCDRASHSSSLASSPLVHMSERPQ